MFTKYAEETSCTESICDAAIMAGKDILNIGKARDFSFSCYMGTGYYDNDYHIRGEKQNLDNELIAAALKDTLSYEYYPSHPEWREKGGRIDPQKFLEHVMPKGYPGFLVFVTGQSVAKSNHILSGDTSTYRKQY